MNTQEHRLNFDLTIFFAVGTFVMVIVIAIQLVASSRITHMIASNTQAAAVEARIDTLIWDGDVEWMDIQARVEANRLGIEANSQEIKQLRQDLMRHDNRLIRIEELLRKNN